MISKRIIIKGAVQGVGFRPFVYRVAKLLNIKGTVHNSAKGVEIVATGEEEVVNKFITIVSLKKVTTEESYSLETKPNDTKHAPLEGIAVPTKAYVEVVEIVDIERIQFDAFEIIESIEEAGGDSLLFVPTDLAICSDCEAELFDKTDRRYLYPFINCTSCGPRYSIIKSLPYDRVATSMKEFKMCSECQTEYDTPEDRRFHAEPNACPACGPQVYMKVDDEVIVAQGAIDKACELIDAGEIVAIKGIGGYQLLCDATNDEAVAELRSRKARPTKPFAIMCSSVNNILTYAQSINQVEIDCLTSAEAPIVLLDIILPISARVSNSSHVGVMLAYSPLHKVILNRVKCEFIIATSGNLKGEPIVHTEVDATEKLSRITKYILHNSREIVSKVDDSVVTVLNDQVRVFRRGRGFAPYPVKLPTECRPRAEQLISESQNLAQSTLSVLGVGAHLKNTITFSRGEYAYVSQYIGDLESVASVDFANSVYNHLKDNLNINIDVVARDMHRGYISSSFGEEIAKREGAELVDVQHHHAHTYSVMAEHGLLDNLISIVLDGTGYGEDGNIWGGEIFALGEDDLKRVYHLEYTPQLSGDTSAKYPAVMAQSYLMAADEWDTKGGSFWQDRLHLSDVQSKLNENMWAANINSIPTSSAGRLFEGVGAMVLGIYENEYEAHSAIALEDIAYSYIKQSDAVHVNKCCVDRRYSFNIDDEHGEIRLSGVIKSLATDVKNGVYLGFVAYSFHVAFARLLCECCERIHMRDGYKDVALSGGVFQNKLLLSLTEGMLKDRGFNCYSPLFVPANDGGISLGQVYYTLNKKL